ncbi:uncharacterized protein OCT59_005582 [Rhizophagus irregularis]|uniref:Uncharacterized protein n=2 Tax=Rhizophagus irregularis TaxID=588596 RepID=U9SVI9_RHIID|nr:hypothetical protein GLOIN_2v1711332 [Rhizophagus irregularis DAOM 181602=DAOM 197198]EXX55348.1 hypothetical protein RirG_226160 [Rhizophagus irregularis DAOM 197198w]UZO14113.1 hypothetical protein OCT59_005582 [Rhizophagus irregularis]POG60660.1 hypothetical protein GLOIN_2v1711332 [Rhizophagus irregularis DAOM 181602=DAOM 197198]CAG8639809.1 3059_t:CDS:2 [Rhizophagus irregularis]GBC37802.1 F-box/LRR-repeat protein 4-like [Rhizophagus irregularis DAOM 181602=DAOM 197198]|eukprot:XP_025167526.1 hypothetical protein GLOIN_2v1711332 [Rhizophagus irregularis DAOM 181602=DAOM 197198]
MDNDDLIKETNLIPISHLAFSIPLILANIFSCVPLEKYIVPCCLVSRWWNQLATERLWYRFQGLKNDTKTGSFAKFLKILQQSHLYFEDPIKYVDKRSIHNYGTYVKILDLEKLKINQEILLDTLDCCPRIEQLIIGGHREYRVLNSEQMNNIAKRLPELRLFKFNEIEINETSALGAIAENCLLLEELILKRDILCDGKVLLEITKNCKRLIKLDIQEKYYEDEIMLPCLSNCPNLTFLRIHQCIAISELLLLSIYKSCPKLTNVTITNVSEITTEFVIETFKHFKAKTLIIQNTERSLESEVQADGQSITVCLYDGDLGRIINYFRSNDDDEYVEYKMSNNKEQHILKELTLIDFPLNKTILGIICDVINQLSKLELSGIEKQKLSKSDVLEIIPKLKNLRHFSIRFSHPPEPLLEEDRNQLFQKCSQLESIKWHLTKNERK